MSLRWRRRRHDPTAGLGDLEAALAGENCPVCTRTAGADERWLDRFLDDGYLDRDVMRRIAAGGGFCAFHAARMAAIGQSATVALIYLHLIEDCLPRLAARRDRRGGHGSGVPGAGCVRGLCAPAGSRTPRVLFSRAADPGARPSLLWRAGAGLPAASAASRRLSRRARHRRHDLRFTATPRRRSGPRMTPMRLSARLLGPSSRSRSPPAPLCRTPMAPTSPIPVLPDAPPLARSPLLRDLRRNRGCRRRVAGMAGAQIRGTATSCRMCCRCAATTSGRHATLPAAALAPALAARRSARGRTAPRLCRRCRGGVRRIATPDSTGSDAPSGPPRRGAPSWPRCAAAASARSARASAKPASGPWRCWRRSPKTPTGAAPSRAATVCASVMRRGRWRCRTPLDPRRNRRANHPCPPGTAALGTRRTASARRMAGETAAARRRIGRLAQGWPAFRRHLQPAAQQRPVDAGASARHLSGTFWGWSSP